MNIWIHPEAWREIKELPGYVRQRIRRIIRTLSQNPHPSQSKTLRLPPNFESMPIEARRLRIDKWRVIYVIDKEWDTIVILAVRKRPPYDYQDLTDIIKRLC